MSGVPEMDQDTGTTDYRAEREAMQAAGISDGLADFIVEAFHEHDAAGRPPIVVDEGPEPATTECQR